MKLIKVKDYSEMSKKASGIIISEILKNPRAVLIFPSGRTPKMLYKLLIAEYKKNKIDFSKIKIFNLDEYYPVSKKSRKSFYYYLHKNFFRKVNLKESNINLLNGEAENPEKECKDYERKIMKHRIDLIILGVGNNGHIAFNEPGSGMTSKTRVVELNKETIKRNSGFLCKVPKRALTLGIKTILSSRKIILLASGKEKAKAIKHLVKGKISKDWPVSFLREHKNFLVIADKNAFSLDKVYREAKEIIKRCSTKYGLFASGGRKGYKGVWARDTAISLIGASVGKNKEFKKVFRKSLETLKKGQSRLGQIPNAILKFKAKKLQIDYKSIDSSLWFVIAEYFYKKNFRDDSLFKKHKKAIRQAIRWITYRDVGEDITLEQLPTTDWQDAFPNKYGAVISTQALYYRVLELVGDKNRLKKLKHVVNVKPDDKLWNGNFYWAYRWKNHRKYKEIGDWFDSFGNLIAIIFGLADSEKAKKILRYIEKNKIAKPYPIKSIHPVIKKSSKYWEDYYLDAGATPNKYLNGGIWPFIGGFYILTLIKTKEFQKAEKELKLLAEANLKSKNNFFPEWINPRTKEVHGKFQAWSAGTYIWAYNSLKKRKVLF
jgi:glucosamine-6-phosphate deaminase